jgi:hypothetical protein
VSDKIIRVKIEAGDSKAQIDNLDKSMVSLGSAADKASAEINQLNTLNTQTTKTAQAVSQALNTSSNALGDIGRKAGQAGMQIQQFVGQVTAGTSPMVALSQQAADLGFVLGFPLVGAVVGIAAALGGPLISALVGTGNETDKLKEKLTELQQKLKELDSESKKALNQVEIGKLTTEYEKQLERVEALRKEQVRLNEAYREGRGNGDRLSIQLDGVNVRLREGEERLKTLADEMNKVNQTISESLVEGQTKLEDKTTSLNRQLQLQQIVLTEGELAGRLQAAAWQTGAETVSELDAAIKQLITTNYQLEQSQKAAKEAQASLTREIERQAELDKREVEAEIRKNERAKRDQERINQRIANMRLETQTMASEIALQQGFLDGKFSAEQAQLAAQTASKIMAASTEYEQLRALAADDKARQLEAEIAFKEQLKVINEQYAMDQDALSANTMLNQAQYAQQLRDIQYNSAQTAINAISSFTKQGSALQKGLFLTLKGVQAAQSYTSGLTAAMLARATIPYPASEPIAAAQIAAGKISAAAIMATGIAGAFGGGGGGSIGGGGGSYSPSAPTLPTTPQSAPQVGSFEITGLSELTEELRRRDPDEQLPVGFVQRIFSSLESVKRLQGV